MKIRWYRKLDESLVLQRLNHDKWVDVEEISEYNERKHRIGKYHPVAPDQKRYEWE